MVIKRGVFGTSAGRWLQAVVYVGQGLGGRFSGSFGNWLFFGGSTAKKCAQPGADYSQGRAGATDAHHELAAIERGRGHGLAGFSVCFSRFLVVNQLAVNPVRGHAPANEDQQNPDQLQDGRRGRRQVDLI